MFGAKEKAEEEIYSSSTLSLGEVSYEKEVIAGNFIGLYHRLLQRNQEQYALS